MVADRGIAVEGCWFLSDEAEHVACGTCGVPAATI